MPVNLNTIPGPSIRPSPPKIWRWLSALVGLIAGGILLLRFAGKLLGNTDFWWLAIGIPAVFWLILMGCRLVVYMMQQIQANAWDSQREQVILKEVRRGRRILQILAAECSTANASNTQLTRVTDALLRNEYKLIYQTSCKGERGLLHSRLPVNKETPSEEHITDVFNELLERLRGDLSQYSPEQPIAILLESSCSQPEATVRQIWQQSWLQSDLTQTITFIPERGMAAIDHWLDHRITDGSLLLVVALQIAPENPDMTAEAVAGILLGNRLTQKIQQPMAELHRPEPFSVQQDILQEKILQAADWVPLDPKTLQHAWLTGISAQSEAYNCVIAAQSTPPLSFIHPEAGWHNFNQYLGDPGRAGPWLAIAAAAQAINQSPAAHIVISGESGTDTVWNTIVSPNATHKENTE